jgi:GNAT superfamily N-acetyltransferase
MRDLLPANGRIRKLWLGETDIHRDHLLRLDPGSRRSRFGCGVPDDFIDRYVAMASSLGSVIHGFFVADVLRGTGELRPLGPAFAQQAEAAFAIETPWQSHGVGTALLGRVLLAARNRGFKLLHMACLADNRRMQQLALKFDAELTFDFAGVVGEVEAAHPTPLSVMREFVADSAGFATALLDVQARLIRPAAGGANA